LKGKGKRSRFAGEKTQTRAASLKNLYEEEKYKSKTKDVDEKSNQSLRIRRKRKGTSVGEDAGQPLNSSAQPGGAPRSRIGHRPKSSNRKERVAWGRSSSIGGTPQHLKRIKRGGNQKLGGTNFAGKTKKGKESEGEKEIHG